MNLTNIKTEEDLFKAIDNLVSDPSEIISIGFDFDTNYFDFETTDGLFIKGTFTN